MCKTKVAEDIERLAKEKSILWKEKYFIFQHLKLIMNPH